MGIKLYQKYIKRKLFAKIFLANVAILIATISILIIIVSGNVAKGARQKEVDLNTQILENVKEYYEEKQHVVKQIIQQIYYTPASFSYLFDLLEPMDKEDYSYVGNISKLNTFLYANFIRDPDIANIAVYSKHNDESYFYSSKRWDLSNEAYFKQKSWFDDFNDDLYGLKVTSAYRSNVANTEDKRVFTIGANLKSADMGKNSGIILVNFYADSFRSTFEQYKKQISGTIFIFDKQGEVIFDSSDQYYERKTPYFEQIAQSASKVISGDRNVINYMEAYDGSIIAGVIPNDEMFAEVRKIKQQIYIVGFVCLVVSILLNFFSNALFSKRIKTIVQAMRELPSGDVLQPIIIKSSEDEIGQIAFRFNIMQARLIAYINDVYITEIKYKDAAFAALQSQINPHFLSNTLEAIRMKAVMHGNEEVADMVYILSTLFRSTFKSDKIVKVKDEVNHCALYLKLFSYRYRDKLQVTIDVDKQLGNELTGKLILQPIVENSIFHGFAADRNDLRIAIRGRRAEDHILFTIEDNGKGMSADQLRQIQDKLRHIGEHQSEGSIGLINVHERIKYMFGDRYGLELTSLPGEGTTVVIRIPILTKEEKQRVQNTAC